MTLTGTTTDIPIRRLRIAFVGLGHMGGPMAANLVRGGHEVIGFDLMPEALRMAMDNGITIADSAAAAAAADCDLVITMLPSGRHVLDCYRGGGAVGGILAAALPGTLFLDCSTIDVADARAAHTVAVNAGRRALDAPVSGGVVGASAGTLTFMVGADDVDFAQAEPVLAVMGSRIVHCGGPGAGQAAKICNNMILGVSMIAVSEAFVLGRALGLSDQALFDVASTASGQCWALTTNCPVPGPVPSSPANRDYQPGFSAALMLKDLKLAANAAAGNAVATTLGHSAAVAYQDFVAAGGGGLDFSAIITDIQARSGHPTGSDPGLEPPTREVTTP